MGRHGEEGRWEENFLKVKVLFGKYCTEPNSLYTNQNNNNNNFQMNADTTEL